MTTNAGSLVLLPSRFAQWPPARRTTPPPPVSPSISLGGPSPPDLCALPQAPAGSIHPRLHVRAWLSAGCPTFLDGEAALEDACSYSEYNMIILGVHSGH